MAEIELFYSIGKWTKIKKVGPNKSKRHTNRYRLMVPVNGNDYIEIELPNGDIAKCSSDSKCFLEKYHWNLSNTHGVNTVIIKNGNPTRFYLRRFVMNAKNRNSVNHINGDQLDCRKENLEIKKQTVRKDLKQKPEKVDIYYPKIISSGKWRAGKPAGCISKKGEVFTVRFSSPSLRKSFKSSNYDSEDECKKAAEKFRYMEADERGLVRNKIRNVTLTNGEKCLEVQLNDGKSFFCDSQDKNLVEKIVWSATASGDRFYVRHSGRAKQKLRSERFHVKITDYTSTDHINGNGLDNRRSNLREGKGNVNARNCKKRTDNKSGVTGVTFTKGAWIVQWPEGGIRKSKRFGTSYGTLEEAKQAAIDFRLEKNEEQELHPRQ